MQCKKCNGRLEVLRMCRRVRMRCKQCGHQYHIHEVIDQLDEATLEVLANQTAIVYD